MKVSVVMACHNSNLDLLKNAVSSVLRQTFADFEFVIVDDGSDVPLDSQLSQCINDKRIRTYRIMPSGLGAALNYGIDHSNGEFIARLDDDDIMFHDRLQKQVDYLESHPEVSCVGTQIFYKVGNRCYRHKPFPTSHEEILEKLANLHFVMAHTSIMFRRSSFDLIGGYRIKGGGQDLDLFFQLGRVGKMANLEDFLTFYTLSSTGLSVVNPKKVQAYLFALNSAVESGDYSHYSDILVKSIENLKIQVKGNKRNVIGRIKRWLLIFVTKFFGKRYVG